MNLHVTIQQTHHDLCVDSSGPVQVMEARLHRERVGLQPLQQRHIKPRACVAVLGRVDVGVHQPRHEELAVIQWQHKGTVVSQGGLTGESSINGAHCGASWMMSTGLKPKSCVSTSSSEPLPMKAIWWQIDSSYLVITTGATANVRLKDAEQSRKNETFN